MSLSFYETCALARKAARGAGYEWGLAEEAAFATGWLCQSGVDGAAVLSDYFRAVGAGEGADIHKHYVREWPSESDFLNGAVLFEKGLDGRALCPLSLGVSLSDFGLPSGVEKLVISKCYAPLLLLPFIANLPAPEGFFWRIEWGSSSATDNTRAVSVVIELSETLPKSPPESEKKQPLYPQGEDAFLLELAARTYVPESEESRNRGAGE